MVCIFRLNKKNHIIPCRTGSHLQDCSEFECNKEYKCPLYYCIPWGYVCDGKWDCPHGEDEVVNSCIKYRNCREMYSCHKAQACIHISDICDGFIDCLFGDDEAMCSLFDIKCPKYCQCLLYALYCAHISIKLSDFWKLPHISYHIINCSLNTLSLLFGSSEQYFVLNFSQNRISDVCREKISLYKSLYSINFGSNMIESLSKNCFYNLYHLHIINLQSNQIRTMEANAFRNLRSIYLVDLSMNHLGTLGKAVFVNVTKLFSLLLYKNNFKALHSKMQTEFNIQLLVTSIYAVCCLLATKTQCVSPKTWLISYSPMISNLHLQIIFVLVMFFIVVFNLTSFATNYIKTEQKAFTMIVLFVHSFDIICGLYFLLFLAVNLYYGINFVFSLSFSSSYFCHFMFCCVTIYSVFSPMILLLLSVVRLMVVLHPLTSRFKQTSFVTNLLGFSAGCSFVAGDCFSSVQICLEFSNKFTLFSSHGEGNDFIR